MSNPHRLSRLQRFLLRNHDLLPTSDLASFLGVDTQVVHGWMQALGLPSTCPLDKERAFPLIVRRNHDLLTHSSIARLLGMTQSDYEKAVQEMDFLAVKVGAKPEVIDDLSIDDFDKTASASFKDYASDLFSDSDEWERPFSFLAEFSQPEQHDSIIDESTLYPQLRMMYSYTASHGDFLLTGEDFYSEGILSRLKNRGVNAGWLPLLLRDIAPSKIFSEFGQGHQVRIENLRAQVAKARKYGIQLYAYINEPRFMPGEFFDKYPEAKGMESTDHPGHFGMCTSSDMVRQWIGEAAGFLFSQVPDLGGVIIISASENRTNCFSHLSDHTCPACMRRGIANVLADMANIVMEVAESVGSRARVIQWLWGWDFIMDVESVKDSLVSLHPKVEVMVDWARHTQINIHGVQVGLIEYTIGHMSPSKFARDIINAARMQGRAVHAKCSIVSTVESNALPYMPVMTNIDQLLNEIRSLGVDGMLGCWIFGAYPGRNMEMLAHQGEQNAAEAMAIKYYGSGADEAIAAWRSFGEGMRRLPHTLGVLYHSALIPGPGLRFSMEPESWRHGMGAMASERIDEITEPFGPEIVIMAFREATQLFAEGIGHLEEAVAKSELRFRTENEKDLGICTAYMIHLITAASYTEFVIIRNRLISEPQNRVLRSRLIDLLKDELVNSRKMLGLCSRDSRIGYEGAIGYFYTPVEIIEKMYDIAVTLNVLEGKEL
ncbi:hypothetical protein LLG46_14505 [bacterium]|nr:hypothetical protein [bacterium]